MDKRFALILVAIIAIIGGIFLTTKKQSNSDSSNSNSSKATTSNHSEGAGTSGVTLVEYGDFQCPVCGRFYPLVESVVKKYGDQVKFTFRHFPLDSVHNNARAAHRAAEAAGIQGKFFEMYRLIYENQSSWSDLASPLSLFEGYASQLGLNIDKYKSDFASSAVNDTINADEKEGQDKYKIEGTPTFVLNGKVLDNTEIGSVDLFSKQIDAALASASPAATPTEVPTVQ